MLFLVFYLYLCILSCVVLHIIALSIERTWLTFTFMHLADAFIQSDLQCIQAMHLYCLYVCSLGIEPTTFALLTQCSTTEPQEHLHFTADYILYNWVCDE